MEYFIPLPLSYPRLRHMRHAIAHTRLRTCVNVLRRVFCRTPKTDMNPLR